MVATQHYTEVWVASCCPAIVVAAQHYTEGYWALPWSLDLSIVGLLLNICTEGWVAMVIAHHYTEGHGSCSTLY